MRSDKAINARTRTEIIRMPVSVNFVLNRFSSEYDFMNVAILRPYVALDEEYDSRQNYDYHDKNDVNSKNCIIVQDICAHFYEKPDQKPRRDDKVREGKNMKALLIIRK